MTERDFRYTMLDGRTVEAFQVTADTRYQEKDWPEWMNSRYLVTVDTKGKTEEWLNINDVETRIPAFGWIVREADGTITAVDYTVMETADKVVKEEQVQHPEAEIDEDKFLELAAKTTGRPIEELRAEQELKKANPPITIVEAPRPDDNLPPRGEDRGLVNEVRGAFEALVAGENGKAHEKLREALLERANWCNCPPGRCNGERETWDCRRNSPLAQ